MSTDRTLPTNARAGHADDLVARLTAELRPVRPVRMVRMFLWFLFGEIAAAALATRAVGVRPDIGERLAEPAFLLLVAALVLAAAGSASAAVRTALPGRYISRSAERWLLASPLVLAAVALVLMPWEGEWAGWGMFLTGCWKCTAVTAASAAAPWLVAVLVLRRLAPLVALRVAMFAGFSAFFIGALVTQLHCPMGSGMHLAFAHFLPVALLSAVVCGATAAVLRRRYR